MRIVLVTDAWHPQVNGVVHTWTYMVKTLTAWGHEVVIVSPQGSRTIAAPSEPDVRLCIEPMRHLLRVLDGRLPDSLHIATEGPLGLAARRLAKQRGWRFTTGFHTLFPDYLTARLGVPVGLTWKFMKWFHQPSQRVLVPTPTVRDLLARRGLGQLQVWARGVDTVQFAPGERDALPYRRPIFLSIGRVAREKNLDAFLSLDLPGTKVVVGGGPDEARLRRTFPDAIFLGSQPHSALAPFYRSADVFVFPSRTDTFGLVMLESMACGTPVAAFPDAAPRAVLRPRLTGVLSNDLRVACLDALKLDRAAVRQEALCHSWEQIARELLHAQVAADPLRPLPPPWDRASDTQGAAIGARTGYNLAS